MQSKLGALVVRSSACAYKIMNMVRADQEPYLLNRVPGTLRSGLQMEMNHVR